MVPTAQALWRELLLGMHPYNTVGVSLARAAPSEDASHQAPIAHCSAIVARRARAATSHLTGSPAVDLF